LLYNEYGELIFLGHFWSAAPISFAAMIIENPHVTASNSSAKHQEIEAALQAAEATLRRSSRGTLVAPAP
jgi:hypothetical protein